MEKAFTEERTIRTEGLIVQADQSEEDRLEITVYINTELDSEAAALAHLARRQAESQEALPDSDLGGLVKRLWKAAEHKDARAYPYKAAVVASVRHYGALTSEQLLEIRRLWQEPLLRALPLLTTLGDRISDLARTVENIDTRLTSTREAVNDFDKRNQYLLGEITDKLETVESKAATVGEDLNTLRESVTGLTALVHDLAERLTVISTRAPWYKRLLRRSK